MKTKILLSIISLLMFINVNADCLVAKNVTYGYITFYRTESTWNHVYTLSFFLSPSDSIEVDTHNIGSFIRSIVCNSDYISDCSIALPFQTYYELWGERSQVLYDAANNLQQEFGRMAEKLSDKLYFSLDDGTKGDIEYMDIAAIFSIKDREYLNNTCTLEFSLKDFDRFGCADCIDNAWVLVSVAAYSKSKHSPIINL